MPYNKNAYVTGDKGKGLLKIERGDPHTEWGKSDDNTKWYSPKENKTCLFNNIDNLA